MNIFTNTYWNETLAALKFSAPSISGVVDINALANELAENLTKALDTVAPMNCIKFLTFQFVLVCFSNSFLLLH